MHTHRLVILLALHQCLQWHWSQTTASYFNHWGNRWTNTHQLIHVQLSLQTLQIIKKDTFSPEVHSNYGNFYLDNAILETFCYKLSGKSYFLYENVSKKGGGLTLCHERLVGFLFLHSESTKLIWWYCIFISVEELSLICWLPELHT